MQMGEFAVDQKTVLQLTELTLQQKLILKQLAIKEPASMETYNRSRSVVTRLHLEKYVSTIF